MKTLARTIAATLRVALVLTDAPSGGPDALTAIVAGLPADLPVPVVVVQHMPPLFTRMFAERLDRSFAESESRRQELAALRGMTGYLRHLLLVNEPTVLRLVSLHNLAYLFGLLDAARRAVAAGTLATLRTEVAATWDRPPR